MLVGNHNYIKLLNADEILITDNANLIDTIILRLPVTSSRQLTNPSACIIGKKARKQVDKNFSLRNGVGCWIGIDGVKSKETRHIMAEYNKTVLHLAKNHAL